MRKSLPSSEPPEGFRYQTEVLPLDEEQELVEQIRELHLREFELHGYAGKRRVISFGWERYSLTVKPRSAYLLHGPARTEWEHSIPPVGALRYLITFRSLRPVVDGIK